jgi:hypothetical protein
MLEFGPLYELTAPVVGSRMNKVRVDLTDATLPVGTEFTVCGWNGASNVELQLYTIKLERAVSDSKYYEITVRALEGNCRRTESGCSSEIFRFELDS